MERLASPEVEEDIDVESVLEQLKRAKEKELLLRAEKERVRKTIGSLATDDLWSRETSTQRNLESVKARKRALLDQHSSEADKLTYLNQFLRQSEQRAQHQRRSDASRSVLKSAAEQVLKIPSVLATSDASEGSLLGSGVVPIRIDDTVHEVALKPEDGSRRSHRTNQETAGVRDKLPPLVSLEEQEKRIKRLQLSIDECKQRRATEVRAERALSQSPIRLEKNVSSCADDSRQSRGASPSSCRSQFNGDRISSTSLIVEVDEVAQRSNTRRVLDHDTGVGPPSNLLPPVSTGLHARPLPANSVPISPCVSLPATTHQGSITGSSAPSYPVPVAYSMMPPMLSPFMYPIPASSFVPVPVPAPTLTPFNHPHLVPFSGYTISGQLQSAWSPYNFTALINPLEHRVPASVDLNAGGLPKRSDTADQEPEFTKLQEVLTGLQHQVSQLHRTDSASSIDSNNEVSVSPGNGSEITKIKKQHQEAVLKIRNERDLLEEQDKLEEVKERVEKRREERRRETQHSEWVTNQKRELMSLQLQRAVSKMVDVNKKRADAQSLLVAADREYDASSGVVLCLDFATGIPSAVEDAVQLAFAVYDDTGIRSNIKAVVGKHAEGDGPAHKRVTFAAVRNVKPLPISSGTFVVVELSSQKDIDGKPSARRLGWATFPLFHREHKSDELRLASGYIKLALIVTPMPDPSRMQLPIAINTQAPAGPSALHLRVAHGAMEKDLQEAIVDPDTHMALYRSPSERAQSAMPTGTIAVTETRPDAQRTNSDDSERDVSAMNQPAPPTSNHDYLDLERLRLLSASSSRPFSGAVRPLSTVSASGKQPRLRTSAGASLLPVHEGMAHNHQSLSSPWIRVDHSAARLRRASQNLFHLGDGFDVLIDGCRYLPDNVGITKVTVAALHADRSKINPSAPESNSKIADPSSPACHPQFSLWLEYREKTFNPTLTLIVRVDTIDVETKQAVILGYALLPVFVEINSLQQPTRSSTTQFALHAGRFQLPVYANASLNDASVELSASAAISSHPKLPCATILIQVTPALTSEDGLSLLSRKDIPVAEWEERGLGVSAPPYHEGAYDSISCVPTLLELAMYQARNSSKMRGNSVQQVAKQMNIGESEVIQAFDAKPASFLQLHRAFCFCPSVGFRFAVDGLHNMKIKAGSFCKVLFSVSPPASFYQPIRFTSDLHLTTTTDWMSLPTSPEFKDGLITIRDSRPQATLMMVIEVRMVTKNLGSYTSQPVAWTFLPVLHERTGAVASGTFQLPLFAGDVKLAAIESSAGVATLLEDIAAERKKTVLPFLDGASVFVRLDDPQVPMCDSTGIKDAVMSKMVPPRAILRYHYDVAKVALIKKKTPLSKQVPAGMTERQLDKEINEALAAQLGITHYSF